MSPWPAIFQSEAKGVTAETRYDDARRGIDLRIAVVKTARDLDAVVWCVEHADVAGLHVEGETFDELCRNVAVAVADLLEGESDGAEIPIEIIAHASVRARVAA